MYIIRIFFEVNISLTVIGGIVTNMSRVQTRLMTQRHGHKDQRGCGDIKAGYIIRGWIL